MTTEWHAPTELLAHFARQPRAIDDATSSSLEAHLVCCDQCRADLSTMADPAVIDASWAALADRIDQPRLMWAERALAVVTRSSTWGRLVAATPGLQLSGLAAVSFIAGAAALIARQSGGEAPFLVIAPLLPLAMVAASFAPFADPAGEFSVATPIHGAGLIVRRAVAALALSLFLLSLAAFALPDLGPEAAAWVLPSLALSIGAIALRTWIRLETAVAVLAGIWIATVSFVWWVSGRDLVAVQSHSFVVATQLVSLTCAFIAAVIVGVRRDQFATLEASR